MAIETNLVYGLVNYMVSLLQQSRLELLQVNLDSASASVEAPPVPPRLPRSIPRHRQQVDTDTDVPRLPPRGNKR